MPPELCTKSDISAPADTLLVPNTANISAELEITLLFTFFFPRKA